jgi:hypothetical protein
MKAVASQVGSAWSELTETAKAEYNTQAKELKTAYDKEYRSFLEGLSDDSIKAIESATGKKLRIPGGKAARKQEMHKAAGGPRKPMTAFFEFMQDHREKEMAKGEHVKATDVAKQAGDKWRNMSESDKQVSPHWVGSGTHEELLRGVGMASCERDQSASMPLTRLDCITAVFFPDLKDSTD